MEKNFACETVGEVRMIPTAFIRALPQVRTQFKEASIQELAADIKAHGVLQPIVVKPDGGVYTVIVGERRLRAIQYLKAEAVPCIVADVTEDAREEIQLIENIQREDLSTADVAGAVAKLWKKHGSVVAVAKRCNKSKSWVSKRLAIALDVGPLTAELIDSNAKDVEMLYAFATLEKADKEKAREILPELLERRAGRKEVKAALEDTLAGRGQDDTEATPEENNQGDLFDPAPVEPAEQPKESITAYKKSLAAAIRALQEIADMAKHLSPLEKSEKMRQIAKDALHEIDNL